MLTESFETSELVKIERSRWSKTKGVGVVDNTRMIGLEMVLQYKKIVDFTKGLLSEERKNGRTEEGISVGKIMDGNVAACKFSTGSSVKTATPRKILSTPIEKANDIELFAKCAVTFDMESTATNKIEEEGIIYSILLEESLASMNKERVEESIGKKEKWRRLQRSACNMKKIKKKKKLMTKIPVGPRTR